MQNIITKGFLVGSFTNFFEMWRGWHLFCQQKNTSGKLVSVKLKRRKWKKFKIKIRIQGIIQIDFTLLPSKFLARFVGNVAITIIFKKTAVRRYQLYTAIKLQTDCKIWRKFTFPCVTCLTPKSHYFPYISHQKFLPSKCISRLM